MTNLVACLSTGKGSWSHVRELMGCAAWEKVFLITNAFGKENFGASEKATLIVVDFEKPLAELVTDIVKALEGAIADTEIALNLASGGGKEHMAILSAMLRLGLGVRLVAVSEGRLIEI